MPTTRLPHAARLRLDAGALVRQNLSGAALSTLGRRPCLWVAGDEACGLTRLALQAHGPDDTLAFGEAHDVPLSALLDLPGPPDAEADIEGLALDGDWLWLTGSHGLKRKPVRPSKPADENARRLARTPLDGNRRLIARIPLELGDDGLPRPVRQAADGRRALRLKGTADHNELTRLLASDPHLGPSLAIPGKDNGFDIEGLAVLGPRLLLGLRGPVLRGWACVLEIELQAHGRWLRLAPLDGQGTLLRKHFLPLEGLGVRDLCLDGDDLLVLAGPTMALDGDIRLCTWAGAATALRGNTEPVTFAPPPRATLTLPHGRGCDRAEALCALPPALVSSRLGLGDRPGPARPGRAATPEAAARPGPAAWLVLYDAPGAERQPAPATVTGDVLLRGACA